VCDLTPQLYERKVHIDFDTGCVAKGEATMCIEFMGAGLGSSKTHWENLITGACRITPPLPGELDWREIVSGRII
jgi:hypothetical protein